MRCHADRAAALCAPSHDSRALASRLRQEGALEMFTRESPAGPARQYYRCTREGERRLRQLEGDWKAMAADVAQFLKGV